MFYLNKTIWFWLNPSALPLLVAAVGLWLAFRGKAEPVRRLGLWAVSASVAFVWFCSTLACVCLLGLPLERPYVASQNADEMPQADAIVILGGGMSACDEMLYPDMSDGADRVWHGARLFNAGKAPLVVVSGTNDLASTVSLLVDFGVPREAIAVDDESRNTYENSRFTERLLGEASVGKRILLVTSAWHMTRALGNFSQTSLEIVPAAADFKAHNLLYGRQHWWTWVAPTADNFAQVCAYAKEWLGRIAKR